MDRKMLALFGIFLVSAFGVMTIFITQHEGVHAAIDKDYGNCSVRTVYAWDVVYTQYSNCTFQNNSDYENFRYLNAENELLGYNVFGIVMAIIFGSFMVAFAVISDKKEKKGWNP